MTKLFRETGIDSCKVTHQRTTAIQHAGLEGLGPTQINYFTHHMLEKQHSAYAAVTDRDTCKVMAGFRLQDSYFVPCGDLPLPHPLHFYTNRLLPRLHLWRRQSTHRHGDKSSCCRNWLQGLLPWFVRVLVQDGIYFIRDYPEHELSNFLRNNIAGYERWALQARRWVEDRWETCKIKNLSSFNQAAKETFEGLS